MSQPRPQHVSVPSANEPPFDFDTIYRRHSRTVARWAARLGGPRIDVEDVVQDVFTIVSRRLADFRGESKLTTWLFAITNQTISNLRRRERWRRWVSRLTNRIENSAPAPQPTAVEEIERREASERFYSILDAMPERHRVLLVLFEVEAYSAAEIGQLLNLRPATVRVRLHRARRNFLKHLEALLDLETT